MENRFHFLVLLAVLVSIPHGCGCSRVEWEIAWNRDGWSCWEMRIENSAPGQPFFGVRGAFGPDPQGTTGNAAAGARCKVRGFAVSLFFGVDRTPSQRFDLALDGFCLGWRHGHA